MLGLAFLPPVAAESASAPGGPAGAAASACCGWFGNAGDWGGKSQVSLCIAGATCTSSDHTPVTVSYFSGAPACPSGSYDCVVTTGPLACGYDCTRQPGCGSYSPAPSCCSGWKGGGCANKTYRGCCLPNQIQMPTPVQTDSSEWNVSYGTKVK
jgi:hypothetical protein